MDDATTNDETNDTATNAQAHQEVLAAMAEHTPNPVCLLDAHAKLVWTNTAWGQARRQISSAGLADWVELDLAPGVHPVRFGREQVDGQLHVQQIQGPPPGWLLTFTPGDPSPQMQQKHVAQMLHSQRLESLGSVAGVVVHDFNNLLTAILGNADLLADDPTLEAHHKPTLQNIIAASELAAELCQQVMAFSGNNEVPKFGTVELSDLVRQMLHMIQVVCAEHGEVNLALSTDATEVLGDATRLQQVVLNLLINAVQAIGPGGAITISSGYRELDAADVSQSLYTDVKPGRYAFVSVQDNGPGVGTCAWQKLFTQGYSTRSAGRGLGLAAVANIVEWHRGTIEVQSNQHGSTFTVLIPVHEVDAVD